MLIKIFHLALLFWLLIHFKKQTYFGFIDSVLFLHPNHFTLFLSVIVFPDLFLVYILAKDSKPLPGECSYKMFESTRVLRVSVLHPCLIDRGE